MELKKATRKRVKIKIGITGPSGSGKTMGALLLAFGLIGDWGKIALIDTENESASLYDHLGDFLTLDLRPPFTPERYIEAMNTCEKAGIECMIIDSTSHEWSGIGGCIEINEKLAAAKFKGNTWSAWSETTPRHDRFVAHILQAPCHVIVCTRSKTDTVLTEDKKVKKVGMKEVQREGFEYEWSVVFNLDRDTHTAIPSKDRTELFEGKDPFIISAETGKIIKDWCEKGMDLKPVPVPPITEKTTPPTVPEKKKMTDAAFTKAYIRAEKGEEGFLQKILDTYTLTEDQVKILKDMKLLTTDGRVAIVDKSVNSANPAIPA